MHIIVIKRSLYSSNPWIARSLTKAFFQAMEHAYEAIHERAALRYILPWLDSHVEETKSIMSPDGEGDGRWWKDGLTSQNRKTLDKFLEYSYNQGLAKKKWEVEEIFFKGAGEEYVI